MSIKSVDQESHPWQKRRPFIPLSNVSCRSTTINTCVWCLPERVSTVPTAWCVTAISCWNTVGYLTVDDIWKVCHTKQILRTKGRQNNTKLGSGWWDEPAGALVMKGILMIPHSSADCEWVFSCTRKTELRRGPVWQTPHWKAFWSWSQPCLHQWSRWPVPETALLMLSKVLIQTAWKKWIVWLVLCWLDKVKCSVRW